MANQRCVNCRLLENNIKGMLTTLPLVLDLHHPAMRERHWLQLMKVRLSLIPSNQSGRAARQHGVQARCAAADPWASPGLGLLS